MPKQLLNRFPLPCTPVANQHEMVNRATMLAVMAAHGQTRKDGKTPQIMHPLAVQGLLAHAGIVEPTMLAAAALHDSIEDTSVETGQWLRKQIGATVGQEVLALVDALTDDTPTDRPRTQRKARQMARLAHAPWEVKVIKLADVVACMHEGPAPQWSTQQAAAYVAQRTLLVSEVLRGSSAALAQFYQQALAQPVWQVALNAPHA